MKKLKIILIVVIFLTLGWMIIASLKNTWNPSKQPLRRTSELLNKEASVVIKHPHYTHTNEDAHKEWELKAESAQFFKEKNLVVFKSPVITFYAKDGKEYTLSGDLGELHTDTQNLKVSGNVTGKGYLGEFKTSTLLYDARNKKATTTSQVQFRNSKFGSLEGKGMVMDVDKKRLTLLSNIKVEGKTK